MLYPPPNTHTLWRAKWFGSIVSNNIEGNATRNQTMEAARELLYQVTGIRLLSRKITDQFLNFEEVYCPYHRAESEALKFPPYEIIGEVEELNQTQRSIIDAAKSHKPQFGYWGWKGGRGKAHRYAVFFGTPEESPYHGIRQIRKRRATHRPFHKPTRDRGNS